MTLKTTGNHPYFIDGEWINASDILPGMRAAVYGAAEMWERIVRFPDYEISSWGRVRHIASGRFRSLIPTDYGRLQVTLTGNVGAKVHKLVADAFLRPASVMNQVRHLDGYAWDNVVVNLAWGDDASNHLDGARHGSLYRTGLSYDDVKVILSTPVTFGSQTALAKRFGVSRETVKDILNRRYHTVEVVGKAACVKFGVSEVVSVEHLAPEMTYGLTVEDDGSHVTNGIVTHNTGTATGRLSSSGGDEGGMNLQNLHNDPRLQNMYVSDKRWRQVFNAIKGIIKTQPKLIWEQLIEQWVRDNMPDLKTFLVLDYGQIEVRVMAQLSGDKNLLADCESADIHTTVGVAMTGWDADKIKHDKKTRTLTKNIHFGIIFLIAKHNLYDFIKAMDPTFDGTEEFVSDAYDRYFERYTGVKAFMDSQQEFAEQNGFVETVFGLHRVLNVGEQHGGFEDGSDEVDSIIDAEGSGRGVSWRSQSVNTPVQGSAHELLECGLVNIRRKPDEYQVLGTPSMDVHDALYFMVNVLEIQEAYRKARYLMEEESLATVKSDFPYIDWKVPITTECEAGLRLGGKVVLEEGKFTIGSFLLDWYKITKKQIVELHEQLKVVPVEDVG
jgi:hypothetical protein